MTKLCNTMRKIRFYKKYILRMTFFDLFYLIVDLSLLASLIIFTFYFGVEVGRELGGLK